MERMVRALLVAACLGAGLLCAGASPAAALTTCSGSQVVTYAPGVTNTPKPTTVTVASTLPNRLSLTDPTVTAGVAGVSIDVITSCTDLLTSGSATTTFTWSNGRTSVFAYTFTATALGGTTQIEQVGTITAGAFASATAIGLITTPSLNLTACGSPGGITRLSGPYELTIV